MTHEDLCDRARRWLSGTRRCQPIFSNCASCMEIPDAIGWSSAHQWRGSTVVECKTSVNDFYADQAKFKSWNRLVVTKGATISGIYDRYPYKRFSEVYAQEHGYVMETSLCMGDYRFYLCPTNVLTEELVRKHAPDHGLLWLEGSRIKIVRNAPKRERVDKDSEIRYLRFTIINNKKPFAEWTIQEDSDGIQDGV